MLNFYWLTFHALDSRLQKVKAEKIKQRYQRKSKYFSSHQINSLNECTGHLSDSKRPERLQKTTNQVNITLKEVAVLLSRSTIKKHLYECKYSVHNKVQTTSDTRE